MKTIAAILSFLFLGLSFSPNIHSSAWPQWRGPQRDGISPETGLLKTWPENSPKLLWQADSIGSGYSTPAVVGDRLYVLSNEGLDNEYVMALSVGSGEELWSTQLGKVGKPEQRPNYPAARSTPTIDGDRIYALGSDGDLACLDAKTGKAVWTKNLPAEFGGDSGTWAYSESPLIDGGRVICTPGGSAATLLALDKATGAVVWKCSTPEGDKAGYSSAILAEIGGVRQLVQFLEKGLVGVDAGNGRLLWRYAKTAEGSPANIPTPVAQGSLIYSGAGRTGGGLARITRGADGFSAEEVYFSKKLPTAIGGAVLIGDYLYGAGSQALLCVEFATGKILWEERSVAPGSLVAADGNLILHGESGDVALLEATAEGYRERGRFTPKNQPDRGRSKAWAYPVVADGRLYLRDWTSLWCYDLRDN
jgi:outer membrane protein assembly factor BamB